MSNVIAFPAAAKSSATEISKFKVGKTYTTRFACDADMILSYEVVARTEKSVSVKDEQGDVKTRRIKIYCGEETVRLGSYSMAPILRAERSV